MVYETLLIDDELKNSNSKSNKKNSIDYYVKYSFIITYILLLTTAIITFIEAIRTPNPSVRHIMNLETAISLTAGYFYSIFVGKLEDFSKNNKPIDWNDFTLSRYIDWSITTPMMLIVLSLYLGSNTKIPIKLPVIISIVILNYLMLYIGYLGEIGRIARFSAMILGFIPFILMFGIIFMVFVRPKFILSNYIFFTIFVTLWSMYGIVFMFDDNIKNIVYNILDCIAKCFLGLGLWAYYSKIFIL